MNKKSLVTLLLAFFAIAGQAKTYKTIKSPVAMACVNVYQGELKAREVIFRDTATTVHFTIDYPKGRSFSINGTSYLLDQDGNRYALRSAEGITLNKYGESTGTKDFTLHFEPMPKQVQVFDYIEGDGGGAFMLLGIHDKKHEIKVPTMQELSAANPYAIPQDWFKTDTITIRGRIEDYNAERFGFTSLECYYQDVFDKDDATLVLNIEPDGTFCKKFQASYPIQQSFRTRNTKVGFSEIPFFARPGETIDITVRKNAIGRYECIYNSGSSHDVQRWLRSERMFGNLAYPLYMFKGNFAEANKKADEIWNNMMYRLYMESQRNHYTPMEMQMALADAQVNFAYGVMDYAMYRNDDLEKQEKRDGVYHREILDSAEWLSLKDYKNYTALHRIDFDNPLLIASNNYPILLNRIQFAEPVYKRKFQGMINEHGAYEYTSKNVIKILENNLAALRDLMGSNHDNMMAQLCVYKEILSDFNDWRNNEDAVSNILADTTITEEERKQRLEENVSLSKMFPVYVSPLTTPYIHQKAEQFYAHKMAQKDLATPLPDEPIADVIRKLSAKYPGKFLMIDFWGMGCGPCRSAIQSSKQMRAEIAKRDDVKLIFIAGERTTGGSDSYKNYVEEWLAGEETVCLTDQDFTRMRELFRFNGIPHYETITPDCRRVRDDIQINGFHHFEMDLNRLKEKYK